MDPQPHTPYVPPAPAAHTIPIDPVPPLHSGRKAALPLHIVVVGCGLGGLAAAHTLAHAGHHITLLEAAPVIGDVGAGIQVSPNATRLLLRWGLGSALSAIAVRPEAIVFRRYDTGERVGYTRWGDVMDRSHGAPYLHVHRADYHAMLLRLARAAPNVTLRLGATVIGVDPDPASAVGGPSVTLASGEVVRGDLIVGADGVKSMLQAAVTGKSSAPRATGDAAYRAIIPTDVMLRDPELRPFVETPEMTAWMAPGRHLMAYNIRGKKEFNLVLLHPDDGSVESWTAEGSADKMRADFKDFEPRVQKLLAYVNSTLKWRLMDRPALESWVHPNGRIVLLGDACHPMLPYRAQGAAMAIEDAGVLGALLSHLSTIEELPVLLKAYQDLRLDRTSDAQEQSRLNRSIFHLPDGPEQRARDSEMRRAMAAEFAALEHAGGHPASASAPAPASSTDGETLMAGNPNQWADRRKSERQFSYDADGAVHGWWTAGGRALLEEARERAEAASKEKAKL